MTTFLGSRNTTDDQMQHLNDPEPSRCPPCSGVSFWPEDSRTVKATILRFHLRQQGSNVSPLLSSFLNPTGASWVIRSLTVTYFSEHRVFPNMLIKSFSKAHEMRLICKNFWLLCLVLSLLVCCYKPCPGNINTSSIWLIRLLNRGSLLALSRASRVFSTLI